MAAAHDQQDRPRQIRFNEDRGISPAERTDGILAFVLKGIMDGLRPALLDGLLCCIADAFFPTASEYGWIL